MVVVAGGVTLVVSWPHVCRAAVTHMARVGEKMVVGGQVNWSGVSVPRLLRTHSTYDSQPVASGLGKRPSFGHWNAPDVVVVVVGNVFVAPSVASDRSVVSVPSTLSVVVAVAASVVVEDGSRPGVVVSGRSVRGSGVAVVVGTGTDGVVGVTAPGVVNGMAVVGAAVGAGVVGDGPSPGVVCGKLVVEAVPVPGVVSGMFVVASGVVEVELGPGVVSGMFVVGSGVNSTVEDDAVPDNVNGVLGIDWEVVPTVAGKPRH